MKTIVQSKYGNYLILGLVWIFSAYFVDASGEFAINDDWAYTHNVFELSQNGNIYFSFWPGMSLITQTVIGTISTVLFGFSFLTLRVTTLLFSLLTIWILYRLIILLTKKKSLALFGSLLLMTNPIFFSLSFTFMTEIYYLFFMILAIRFFYKYIEWEKKESLISALIVLVLAVLVRQTALILAIAFCIVWLFSKDRSWKNFFIGVSPIVIGYLTLFLYKSLRLWYSGSLGTFSDISALFRDLKTLNFNFYIERIGIISIYLGLFLLPLTIAYVKKVNCCQSWRNWTSILLIFGALGFCIGSAWHLFSTGNIFYNFGLGPKLLKDSIFNYNSPFVLSNPLWLTLKIAASVSLGFLILILHNIDFSITHFFSKENSKKTIFNPKYSGILFLILLAIGESFYLLINPIYFDRYSLPLTVILILLVIQQLKEIPFYRIAISTLILSFVFSILMTKDYMSWQRTRAIATNYAIEKLDVKRSSLDGGIEYNAWYQVAPITDAKFAEKDKGWWFVEDDEYLIASGDFIEYRKLKGFRVPSLLSISTDSIFILQKYSGMDRIDGIEWQSSFNNYSIDGKLILNSNDEAFLISEYIEQNEMGRNDRTSIMVGPNNPYALDYQVSNLKLGEKLNVSIWHKGAPSILVIDSKEDNGPVKRLNSKHIAEADEGWKQMSLTLLVDSTWVGKSANIYLFNPNNTPSYFDDLELNLENP